MEVWLHPESILEFESLDLRERKAMVNALEKLGVFGRSLPFPHASRVRGAEKLWELRPRAGRSRTRALYRLVAGRAEILAIGPEHGVDPVGFRRAVGRAERRAEEAER